MRGGCGMNRKREADAPGKATTYIFICVHLQKVIVHIAQMLPDKCPGDSQYFHCGGHICHRWAGGQSGGTDGSSSLTLALTYELQVEPDELMWLITRGFSRHERRSGLNEGFRQKSCIKVREEREGTASGRETECCFFFPPREEVSGLRWRPWYMSNWTLWLKGVRDN